MAFKYFSSVIVFLFVSFLSSTAQIREIPKPVQETFSSQYPAAIDVDYKDQLVKVNVHFTLDSSRMIATYTNKGAWKETEKEWDFEKLTEEVKDGFYKSKFANEEWEIKEAAIVYLPGGAEQFRVKVEKNDLQKKYLFFNSKGRLLREAITL